MRFAIALLLITTSCVRARVTVQIADVARASEELGRRGRAKVNAAVSPGGSVRQTSAVIRRDQRVEIRMGSRAGNARLPGRELYIASLAKLTFGELLTDCPTAAFTIDAPTRAEFPHCVLLLIDSERVEVDRRRYAGPVIWGALGGGLGLGIVTCAVKCESLDVVSTGAVIVGGIVAIVALVAVIALPNKR